MLQPKRTKYRKMFKGRIHGEAKGCLLYTSDAADDLLCVDLGGRRLLKNKTSVLPTIFPCNCTRSALQS